MMMMRSLWEQIYKQMQYNILKWIENSLQFMTSRKIEILNATDDIYKTIQFDFWISGSTTSNTNNFQILWTEIGSCPAWKLWSASLPSAIGLRAKAFAKPVE